MVNANIEKEDSLDVLGMRISCDSSWNDHIFRVSKEAFKYLGFLNRCRTFIRPRMGRYFKVYFEASRPRTGEGEGVY